MRLLLLPLLAALFAPTVQAQSNDSLVVLWVFEARIMFETVIDPAGPNEGRIVVSLPEDAPAALQIAFAQDRRPDRQNLISLTKTGDGTYTGTGSFPAPAQIRSAVFVNDAGRIHLEVPAGWDEGVAAARYRVQPRGGATQTGTVTLAYDLNPNDLSFNIGMPPTAR